MRIETENIAGESGRLDRLLSHYLQSHRVVLHTAFPPWRRAPLAGRPERASSKLLCRASMTAHEFPMRRFGTEHRF